MSEAWLVAEQFILLSPEEQGEIISALASKLGRTPAILEKDAWVCWTLDALFTMPGRVQMAFKGGTSLSKVYGAIHRFSEDIDVTLDYRDLEPGIDPFEEGLSRTKQKKLTELLRNRVRQHVDGTVVPHFRSLVAKTFPRRDVSISVDDAGEKVVIAYGGVSPDRPTYLRDSVLLEFGGRNITEPNERCTISSYMADASTEGLQFPSASVDVLSPVRTFWEKATLIHSECNRGVFKAGAERLSRHWYDLTLLADHDIGRRALKERAILESVVEHKAVFFHIGYANYSACLEGRCRLVPDIKVHKDLEEDYNAMINAGMFERAPPAFAEVIGRLGRLEADVNGRKETSETP